MSAEARAVSEAEQQTQAALARLEADGLIESSAGTWKTTRRWQRGMARAAVALYEKGDPGDDLRVPIALTLLQNSVGELGDETLAELIEAMLPIELAALGLGPRTKE